ncbi:hypothetical protein ACQ4N7_27685 [Nodosilinea sp. AN01ver1]|uniref:hypothetical protein n=1 Tax=Nodosilinea sp. AN01ver1 TaxID=3423362 RepID=UPI003D315133
MRHSAMWFWLIAAAVAAGVQRPGLSAEVQNPHLVEAEVTVAQSESTEDRKAEADHLFEQGTQQYQRSQFREALQAWEAALAIYEAIEESYVDFWCMEGKEGRAYPAG